MTGAVDERAGGGDVGLAGACVVVVGLGRSGTAAARALVAAGATVSVLEGAEGPAALERAAALHVAGVTVELGADLDDPAALSGADLVVPSPGVPPARGLLATAVARGVPVWSEPELAWRLAGGRTRLVGITGTNGKTSTTELTAAALGVPAAGNIGTPLVELLAGEALPLAVAELSSFQLHFCHDLRPDVAVLLNLAPDHLDWHGVLAAYGDDKARVWQRQRPTDVLVVNGDDEGAAGLLERHTVPGRVVRFTLAAPGPDEVGVRDGLIVARLDGGEATILGTDELAGRGPHHVANACAATAAALCAGASPERVSTALRAHRPGPHRLEHVAEVGGVAYVNDSKATNPHAAAAALAAYGSVVWIAGGLAKGLDFAALCRELGIEAVEAGTLDRAVARAAALARPGDTVLLAPACASMDQFTDYAERGQAFRDAVARLGTARSTDDAGSST